MRLTIEIQSTGDRYIYRVFDDNDTGNAEVCGTGWAIRDAVDDFVEEFNRMSFYDDDTPVYISRDNVELKRVCYKFNRLI